MKTYKILGLFLSYPTEDALGHWDEMMAVLEQEELLPVQHRENLAEFVAHFKTQNIYQIQENYVDSFDQGAAHSLHLFDHLYSESQMRGQAMHRLVETYAEKGLYIVPGEMPDYLPLFLEFLSVCPAEEAVDFLGNLITVMAIIGVRLRKRESRYGVIFKALEALSKVRPDDKKVADAGLEPSEEGIGLEDGGRDYKRDEAAVY
ncbi:MAG: nitrate reductase molybdenum cofactor assembly chaperone [Emcibacter sp.]|nr:nitrate reductase molybdenum cofactor assembly chaperone [Emcibacter sp.]